jgi:hypothetical protein
MLIMRFDLPQMADAAAKKAAAGGSAGRGNTTANTTAGSSGGAKPAASTAKLNTTAGSKATAAGGAGAGGTPKKHVPKVLPSQMQAVNSGSTTSTGHEALMAAAAAAGGGAGFSKPEKTYIEGSLSKKATSGISGFRKWQKRYFVLTNRNLLYYVDKEDKMPKGSAAYPLFCTVDLLIALRFAVWS